MPQAKEKKAIKVGIKKIKIIKIIKLNNNSIIVIILYLFNP